MSGRRDERRERLLRRLAELAPRGGRAEGPELAPGRLRTTPARVLALRDERCDPLTGHRGAAEGLLVAFAAGEWIVELQVLDEAEGLVLRGQLLPAGESAGSPSGAMLHVDCGGRRRLACADERGELVLRGLPDAGVERVVLELEDGLHELPWPAGGGAGG